MLVLLHILVKLLDGGFQQADSAVIAVENDIPVQIFHIGKRVMIAQRRQQVQFRAFIKFRFCGIIMEHKCDCLAKISV